MQYTRNNRAEIVQYMMKVLGLGRSDAELNFDERVHLYSKDGKTSEESIRNDIELARKTGMLKGEVPSLSQMVDFSIVDEVQKELGL